MFNSDPIVVGLEVGTTKVVAMVGEVNAEGALNIIGVGQAKSRGVRKAEIVDTALAAEDIRNAIAEAEAMANSEIRSVYLGVSGGHVRSLNNRGVVQVLSADREIMREDVETVIKNAKAINVPEGNHVVHAIRQHFLVDSRGEIADPVGMPGTRLEVDMHVVHGTVNRLQNSIRVVRSLQLEVEDIVFNGLASALALLAKEQKEMGALVIDLGAGATEYGVFSRGIIRHMGVLAVGGDHVSNDLAFGLKIPLSRAEKMKIEHGAALVEESIKGRTVTFSMLSAQNFPDKTVNLEHLRKIMVARLEEVFQLIAQDLNRQGLLQGLGAGISLCGGGANTPGIARLAESVFGLPAYLAHNTSINGLTTALDHPEFATALGLVKYASQQHRKKKRGGLFSLNLKETVETINLSRIFKS